MAQKRLRARRVGLRALVALPLVAISASVAIGSASHGDPVGDLSAGRLDLNYGPYLGVDCREPNKTGCDKVGLDVVLEQRASLVTAWIGGRRVILRTPGLHNGVRGRDWVGFMRNAGMSRKDSPLYISPNGRDQGTWVGIPPVIVAIRITATVEDGRRLTRNMPHVWLHAGWG
jgi:hypothetical protein